MSQYQHGNGTGHSQYSSSSGQQQQQQHRPTPPVRSASGRGFRRGSTWREANANGPPRRMEVSIPQKSLKVFAQAVQCLMKVGKELFIETTADQLILRTLNDAKSAFAAFYFNDSGGFFETFRCDASRQEGGGARGPVSQESGFDQNTQSSGSSQQTAEGGGSAASVSCKVLVRAVHSILRTLKKVVRLVIYVEGEDDEHIEPHLVFQMYCEFGYRKVHRFSLQDCEIMHAVFEGEGAARLSCPPVQLSQLLEHIHGTAEVAVGASHDILTVRSYHHPLTGSAERAVLKTEMSISTAEFDTYRFFGADDEEVELVFSLKEIKALLHFSETTEALTLEMLFREGGDPLLFQSSSNTFAAELIMATMEPKIIVRKEPAAAAAAAEQAEAAGGVKRVAGATGGERRGVEGEGDQRGRGGGGVRDREEGDGGDGGGDGTWTGSGSGTRRGGPVDGGGGDSQDSEATRTPASQRQHFDNDPFGKQPPARAGDGFAGSDPRNGGGGEGSPQERRQRNRTYEDDDSGSGGGGGGGGGGRGHEDERDGGGQRQHRAEHQHDHHHHRHGEGGSFKDEEDGRRGRRGRRRSGGGGGGVGGSGAEADNDDGGRRGSTPAAEGQQQQQQQQQQESEEEEEEEEDGQGYDEVPETEAQRESELPTQFPGVRDAFESELPTQPPGTRRAFDATNSGGDHRGGGDRRGMAGDGGGREDDEDGGGPVQGSKRRRRVVDEDEEEEGGEWGGGRAAA